MFTLLALLAQSALASPGLTHLDGEVAAVNTAEVLYDVKADGKVHATFGLAYEGDAESLGWLIPIFGRVLSVHNGNLPELQNIREVTQPILQRFEPSHGTNACGCADSQIDPDRDTGAPAPLDDVYVIDSGYTGHYTYEIITGNAGPTLEAWFEKRGLIGFDPDELDRYLDLGAHFVAVYYLPTEAPTPDEGSGLPPLRIVFEGDLRFPAPLARHQGNSEVATTFYVLGGGLALPENGWTADPVDTLHGTLDDDPRSMWHETRALAGASKNFVLTYGKGYEGRYLTRLDTVASPDQFDTDIVLKVTSEPGIHETRIILEESGQGGSAAILLLPLAGAALRRRNRRA